MSPYPSLSDLRLGALACSLSAPTTLGVAVERLGFVQADPIRAPARAQDLILRHRVSGYRAGDLERRFVQLGLEEDFLYAHGFMPREASRLLHPRPDRDDPALPFSPSGLAAEVLAIVHEMGEAHPRDLEARFGRARAINAWGGFSKATAEALHKLHYHGHLRVVRRRQGIRIYAPAHERGEELAPEERAERLVLRVVSLLQPISEVSLRGTLALMRRGAPGRNDMLAAVERLKASAVLASAETEGERYLWTADAMATAEAPRGVRFLAPFDPIVWDRRRFTHLWGWTYRFEAYTPPKARRYGYYAMPLLWRDRVIGWVNATVDRGGLDVSPGFVGAAPKAREFWRAFDAEVARLATFLATESVRDR